MKKIALTSLVFALLISIVGHAQEFPEMPKPQKEHAWLKQLEGEWDSEMEVYMEPGKPPMKMTGTENARMIGGFWLMAENTGKMLEMPFTGILTLGYDTDTKKYVGTWIDSVSGYPWRYNGTVDGNRITLETKGPCPKKPGTLSNFKEVIELKNKDEKVFTSSMQEDDGKWTKMLTINYTRKKK